MARRRAARLARPRTWSVRPLDVTALLVGIGALILAMWVRHGGLDQLHSVSGIFIAFGQLTALYGAYLALVQLVLMSRAPWLEQVFGIYRLAAIHRWVGFACLWLLVGHGVGTTIGYALGDRSSVLAEAWTLLTTYPYVLMATVGFALFVAVAVTSIRAARRRLSYETWFGIHLYAYLAIALAFLHQLFVGADFVHDPVARGFWIALYVVTFGLLLVFRVGHPIVRSLHHDLRVANVVQEAPGIISIYVTGRDLERLPVASGQYFVWRFLTRDGWWKGNPFSISAAPNGQYLRTTVKALGDWSDQLQRLRVGTRVFFEGPYGTMTGARRSKRGVLLIAGGVGITPLRSLVEDLPANAGDLAVIYRARSERDVIFRKELDTLARLRGAVVHYRLGHRPRPGEPDPLGPAGILAVAPDVALRDVYLCGPRSMMEGVRRALRRLSVPDAQIHWERFDY
jgi:predicted ferric reductase